MTAGDTYRLDVCLEGEEESGCGSYLFVMPDPGRISSEGDGAVVIVDLNSLGENNFVMKLGNPAQDARNLLLYQMVDEETSAWKMYHNASLDSVNR